MGGVKRSGRFRTINKQTHRVPILPFRHAPNGYCRLCGTKVSGRRKTWCSEQCILNWGIASNHRTRRRQVYLRDKGVCALCNKKTEDWQADHIKPLIECSRGNIEAFLMGNLRTLCAKCHSGETSALNRRRRKEKKAWAKTIPKSFRNNNKKKGRAPRTTRKKERRLTNELLRQLSHNPTAKILSKMDQTKRRSKRG